jgi:hypothetical protein
MSRALALAIRAAAVHTARALTTVVRAERWQVALAPSPPRR